MKTCPECGSILADNEPYCENCGFNPDFDVGSWNYGQTDYTRKYHARAEPIKNTNHYMFAKESFSLLLIAMFVIFLLLFLFRLYW